MKPGTSDSVVTGNKRLFLEESILLTAQLSGISPLRIQHPSFHIDANLFLFFGTMLERAPPVAEYRKIPGKVQQYKNDATFNISNVYDCSMQCNSYRNFTCQSFDLCQSKSQCSISKRHVDDGQLVSNVACDHYSRTIHVGAASKPATTLAVAWTVLKDQTDRGNFVLNIPFSKKKNIRYQATSITNNVLRSDISGGSTTASANNLQQYRVMYNHYVPNFDDLILDGMAVDDCATACSSQYAFICNSFEYCFDSGQCVLSHLHPDEYPGRIKPKNFCDLYVRNYTSNFKPMPGFTLLSSSNVIYQGIYSPNQCAKLCVDYTSFPCLSFDYCDDIGTCFLGKRHKLDIPIASQKISPMCTHYSRNYIADFQRKHRHIIQNKDSRIVSGVPLGQCARLCVNDESFSCASFDYCDLVQECRLSTASLKNIGQVTLTPSATCDTYTRLRFPDGTPFTPNAMIYYGTINTGYSGGSMGGLAFGMLLIGILLAIGGVIGWVKFRGRANDDMKIQFSKEEADA